MATNKAVQEIMKIAHDTIGWSWCRIGKIMGYRGGRIKRGLSVMPQRIYKGQSVPHPDRVRSLLDAMAEDIAEDLYRKVFNHHRNQ